MELKNVISMRECNERALKYFPDGSLQQRMLCEIYARNLANAAKESKALIQSWQVYDVAAAN